MTAGGAEVDLNQRYRPSASEATNGSFLPFAPPLPLTGDCGENWRC
jgi:hypothetical protein